MLAPPWMIIFFLCSHLAMWVVSFAQTFWIVYKIKKENRVLYNKINNKKGMLP
jgi:hypothetical protein